jgi:flagella basal body P-ring formation protein FlgA
LNTSREQEKRRAKPLYFDSRRSASVANMRMFRFHSRSHVKRESKASAQRPLGLVASSMLVAAVLTTAASIVSAATAADRQNPVSIVKTAEDYVRRETAGLPGQVTVTVSSIDPRTNLTPCAVMEAFTPQGARLWGATAVGVRCTVPSPWVTYVSVTVSVYGQVVHTARPVAAGHTLTADDLVLQRVDVTRTAAGSLVDASQAVGKTLMGSLAAGQPIRQDALRAPLVVSAGQSVKIVAEGPGFVVTTEGKAMSAGMAGQAVQVRTQSGQIISGIARADAVVQVQP